MVGRKPERATAAGNMREAQTRKPGRRRVQGQIPLVGRKPEKIWPPQAVRSILVGRKPEKPARRRRSGQFRVQGQMPLVGRKPETAAEPVRFFGYNARSAYPKNNLAAGGCQVEGRRQRPGVRGRSP